MGTSKSTDDLRSVIEDIALKDSYVLITGETGVEKDLVARLIHQKSKEAGAPFVSISLKGDGEEAARTALFGKGSGSFAGTLEKERGAIEEAQGGTLYLSNIEFLPPAVQKDLAACLVKGEFLRRDSGSPVKVNLRLIAATSEDLKGLVSDGRFLKELYEAVSIATITVPSLRARASDIPEIAQYFMGKFNRMFFKSIKGFSKDSLETLQGYPFPGNVDELEKMIEGISLTFDGAQVPLSKLPLNVLLNSVSLKGLKEAEDIAFDAVAEKIERAYIERVLTSSGGDAPKAAKILRLAPNLLSSKIESLKISV